MREQKDLKQAIETLLFITDQPIDVPKLCQAIGVKDRDQVASLVSELQREYEERGAAIQVIEIAEGFQMATRPDYAAYVRNLFREKMTMRLSTAALETLSIIAYKQPLTRAEIEMIRGVEVIAALETLLEKSLVRVVGRKETVGRPLLYGTTPDFLRHFGLRNLQDLPAIDAFTIAELPLEGAPATGGDIPDAPVAGAAPEGPSPEEPVEPAPQED
ncbi:MAG: SMC-Scp complex subunit ScpB [Elusimicrobia bacterium GWA2_69_24]|nr:MAG: SMC-Scp complex subunit ScpB [Elusimicrobia bacterium GWA2_69_24]HBL18212.1 SMC-Scp complex subunit ScpB [Elusimicrobiota bacterium]